MRCGDGEQFFFKKDEAATEERGELTGASSFAHPVEDVYRAQIEKCIKALDDYELDELDYLREETLQIAVALSDKPPDKNPTARELFDELDDDSNGFLDKLEVAQLCAKLGTTMPQSALATAVAEMFRDGNNEVTFEEFSSWWTEKTAMDRRRRQLRDAFDVVDERGAGALPKAGLQKVLRRIGEDLSTRELQNELDAMLGLQKEMVRADVRKAFDLVDVGGTGAIPKNKMVNVVTKLQPTAVVIENAALLGSSSSADAQQLMTCDEVTAWWEDQWDQERKRKQVQEAFNRVDADGSGTLDKKVSSFALPRALHLSHVGPIRPSCLLRWLPMQNAQEVKLFLSRLGNQIGRSGVDAAFAEMLQIHRDLRDKRCLDAFRIAATGSNTLDRDQVDEAIANLFDCLRGTEFEDAYSQMTHDSAGRVTQSAFLEWYDKEEYGNWEDDSELREVFARVDVDGGGTIDKNELEEVFDDLGSSLTSIFGTSKLDAVFAAMLPDAEGEISYENFKHWWLQSRAENEPAEISFAAFEIWYWRRISAEQAQQETRIVELFKRIDADGSGVLDKQEVAALAAELGTKLKGAFKSSADLEEAFAEMDPDGDEAVTLDAFRSWWHQKKDPPVVEFKVFEEWFWRRLQTEKEQDEARIRHAFERIDVDRSGNLDKQEVAALSRELGEKLSTAFGTKRLDRAFVEMDKVRCTPCVSEAATDSQAIRTACCDY